MRSAERSSRQAAPEDAPAAELPLPGAATLARRDPRSLAPAAVLGLQRAAGNQAVGALLGRRLLRQPKKPEPAKLDSVGDYTYLHDPVARRTTVQFRGQDWVVLTWKRGEPVNVTFAQRQPVTEPYYADQQVELSITSEGWASIHVSETVEDQVLATMPMRTVGIHYDFRFDGESADFRDQDQTLKAPFWRRVYEQRPDPEEPDAIHEEQPQPRKPRVTKRVALNKSYERPDTWKSFGDRKALEAYLKANPKVKAAVIQMPDGRFVVRELSDKELERLAESVRESKAHPESLEGVGRYKGKLARGQFESLWVGGAQYTSLDELADRYYGDPTAAQWGSAPVYRECEIYEMEGGKYFGRRPLTHQEAVARLEQIDKLTKDQVLALESEPGHTFHSLVVAGASGRLRTVDPIYLTGRDDFKAKLAALDAAPDDGAKDAIITRFTPHELRYMEVEVDRERDNPEFAAALRTHGDLTENQQSLFYTEVRDWAQREAIEILMRSAAQVRGIVDDDRKIRAFVQGFPQLAPKTQAEALTCLGVPKGDVGAWLHHLRDAKTAMSVALGETIHFDTVTIGVERLREHARKNMEGVEAFVQELRNGTVDAIKVEGAFGDNIRTRAYKWFGFTTLKPENFPHRDRVPESWPGPLSGQRATFSSLGEQLFANKARWVGSLDKVDDIAKKVAIITGVVIVTVALLIAFNVAGLAIAEAVFGLAEGTAAWFMVGGAIGGAMMGAAEVGLTFAMGGAVGGPGGAALTVLEGAAGGAFFGGIGRLMKGVGAGWRIAGMGSTFLAASAGAQRLKTGRWPWEGSGEELALWFYENALSFALIEAGSVAARPLTEKVGIWSRMQRLGVMPEARAAFIADAVRLNKDLSAFVVRPQRAEAEAARLEQRYVELLERQRKLVQDAGEVIRGKERSAALDEELKAELAVIDQQLKSMRAVRFLAELKVRPVGETQTAFEYQPSPEAKGKIQQFYGGAELKEEPGGIITVKLAGEQHPLVFIPAGTAAPPPVPAPGAPVEAGKVNINTATAKELADEVPGIGKAYADRIVAERTARGGFKSVDDLRGILPPATFAKAAPRLTTVATAPPLQDRLLALDARRRAILERSERTGITDPNIDRLRRMNIGSRRTEKALAEADALITAAEKTGGAKIDAAAKAAVKSRTGAKGVGAEGMEQARADALRGMSEVEIGEALLAFKGLQALTPAAIRGAIWARRAGLDLRGFAETSRSHPVAERNFALETYGRLKDARVAGADQVLADMGASRQKWTGGMWAFEYARYGPGIEKVAQLEMHVEVDGVVRKVDIVLKDGTNVELKNWGEWEPYKEKFLFQFEKDVQQGRFDPALFAKQRYVFREPAPAPLKDIRAQMRARLDGLLRAEVAAKRMTADRAKEVLAAFDKESELVGTSPARYTGAPDVPPPTRPTPVPVPGTVDEEEEKKKQVPDLTPLPAGVP